MSDERLDGFGVQGMAPWSRMDAILAERVERQFPGQYLLGDELAHVHRGDAVVLGNLLVPLDDRGKLACFVRVQIVFAESVQEDQVCAGVGRPQLTHEPL